MWVCGREGVCGLTGFFRGISPTRPFCGLKWSYAVFPFSRKYDSLARAMLECTQLFNSLETYLFVPVAQPMMSVMFSGSGDNFFAGY